MGLEAPRAVFPCNATPPRVSSEEAIHRAGQLLSIHGCLVSMASWATIVLSELMLSFDGKTNVVQSSELQYSVSELIKIQ